MADELERLEGDVDGKPADDAGAGADKDKPGGKGKKAPPNRKRDAVLVALTAAGVVIAWLTFRKTSTAAAASSSSTLGSSANDLSNYPASGSTVSPDDSAAASDGFASLLSALQNYSGTAVSAGTSGASTSTPVTSPSSGTTAKPFFDYIPGAKVVYDRTANKYSQVDPSGQFYTLGTAQLTALQQLGGVTVTDYGNGPKATPPAKTTAPAPKK